MHKPFAIEIPDAHSAVLCLHGFLGSPAHFRPFLPFFPAGHSVYALLLDGHGGTTKDFARTSMEKWEQQVDTAVRKLSETYEEIYIVAHSMGTFFAMEASLSFPKVKGIFLLATPLKIAVRPSAAVNSLKAFFGLHSDKNAVGKAYMHAHSVTLSKNPLEYIGWIPRYLELFRKSHMVRETIRQITVPCHIFQSAKDELVSSASLQYIPHSATITTAVLPESRHFIYTDSDMELLRAAFSNFFKGDCI